MNASQSIDCDFRAGLEPGAKVVSIAREPNPYASLSPSEIVRVRLATGATVPLFVKPLGTFEEGHPDKADTHRERDVYDGLLCDPRLPVPKYHGCVPKTGGPGEALVLEFFPALSLRYQAMPAWHVAARALCRLHMHFAARTPQLREVRSLLRFDDRYFEAWANRAVGAVGARSADLGRLLERALRRHDAALDILRLQPPTLVHNDLAPKNILVGNEGERKVRIVDWELSGIGAGCLDIAHLAAGLDEEAEWRLVETYLDEARKRGAVAIVCGEPRQAIAACKLEKTLYRLARSGKWGLPEETLRNWIGQITRQLDSF